MQLYTRLINEGIFIFWNDENGDEYNLRISIFNGTNKIKILDTKISRGQYFYTLKNIGSGEYEIELNSYKSEKLIQTEVKKVKLASSSEETVRILDKLTEVCDKLDNISSTIDDELSGLSILSSIYDRVDDIKDCIEDPRGADAYAYARFIKGIIREMR